MTIKCSLADGVFRVENGSAYSVAVKINNDVTAVTPFSCKEYRYAAEDSVRAWAKDFRWPADEPSEGAAMLQAVAQTPVAPAETSTEESLGGENGAENPAGDDVQPTEAGPNDAAPSGVTDDAPAA